MNTLVQIYAAIFGVFIGSFLNVLILRLPQEKDVVFTRSACPKCNGKSGKGTKFPINGIRVYDGSMFVDIIDVSSFSRSGCITNLTPLINEQPLLLNPEIDEPSEQTIGGVNQFLQNYKSLNQNI